MKRIDIDAWIAGYERACRAAGTAGLRELFTEHPSYLPSPYAEPIVGAAVVTRSRSGRPVWPGQPLSMEAAR